LNENEPEALEEAWASVQASGKGWVSRCLKGGRWLQSRYPDVDLGFMS
jgi:hypothetical protein